ncbi:MAG: alpha/beta fold hydrolase [Myxococcota bacterium]
MTSRRRHVLVIAIVSSLGAACDDESRDADVDVDADVDEGAEVGPADADDGSDGIDDVPDAMADSLGDAATDACTTTDCAGPVWVPCPLYYDQPDGTPAECTTIDVPLRWSKPDGPTLGVFVQRLRGSDAPARGQLWLLNGGPGGSGADYDSWMEAYRAVDPTLDLYTVDHRGTGRSARLSCPDQEAGASDSGFYLTAAETGPCHDALAAEWGDDLAEFTTTAAARDLGRLMERTAEPGQVVFVYGASYGTDWAHRFLQLFPDRVSGVVLDSIAPPNEDFVDYDRAFDAVGRDFMDLCAADPVCGDKLGRHPWERLGALLRAVADGHCAALTEPWGLDAFGVGSLLANMLMNVETRTYIPAIVYRLDRCDAADVAALEHLLTVIFGDAEVGYYDTLGSDALFYNVALSELWPNEHPTQAAVAETAADLYISTGLTSEIAASQDGWPPYPDDAYVGAWADTGTPLLMMNGDLDPQTPFASASQMAPHFTRPHQTFVRVPRAAHAVTVRTPVADGEVQCGLRIMLSFLADPSAEPDLGCIASIPAESFVGDPELNELVLGTRDLWENAP